MAADIVELTRQCKCTELLSQHDCQMQNCSWSSNGCGSQVAKVSLNYCSQFVANCALVDGCAFVNSLCVPFTGCSAFLYATNEGCQSLNRKCISDGQMCVEISSCNTYKSKLTCVKDDQDTLCHWNGQTCVEASECGQLPIDLNTDLKCRSKIKSCTVNDNGAGCKLSGYTCAENKLQSQCYFNQDQTMECIWNDIQCLDKICQNAPSIYSNDQLCRQFLPTCTTNGIGCVPKSTCEAAQVQQACTVDAQDKPCFWNGTRCVSHSCETAPASMQTNADCNSFFAGCITNGAGCVVNQTCESARIEQACVVDPNGNQCYWGKRGCVLRTCENADNVKSRKDCELYKSSCTISLDGQSCIQKTCYNAPSSLRTTFDCQQYLSTCIAKLGGGCQLNSTCQAIQIRSACIKDSEGNPCSWDSLNQVCREKLCQSYPTSESCKQSHDMYGNSCYWNDKCFRRTCSAAPRRKGKTHQECQAYHKSCTVDHNQYGCMRTSLNCSALQPFQCYKTIFNTNCILQNGQCVEVTCQNITLDIYSHSICNSLLNTCTVSSTNDYCIPQGSCETYLSDANCIYPNGCFWTGTTCINAVCDQITLTTYEQCSSYNCNVNLALSKCQPYTKCEEYSIKEQCTIDAAQNQCYWDNTECKSSSCYSNTTTSEQLECLFIDRKRKCVLKFDQVGCMDPLQSCDLYPASICDMVNDQSGMQCMLYENSCVQVIQAPCSSLPFKYCRILNKCVWRKDFLNEGCYDRKCNEGPNTNEQSCTSYAPVCTKYEHECNPLICELFYYTTDQECQKKMPTCTTNGKYCITKWNCNNAVNQAECVTDRQGNPCEWIESKGCLNKSCSTAPSTYQDEKSCQAYMPGCTSNGNGCQEKGRCTDMISSVGCTTDIKGVKCYWKNSICRYIDCSDIAGSTYFTCNAQMNNCTADGSGQCIPLQLCRQYLNQASCIVGLYDQIQLPCRWINGSCFQYSRCESLQFKSHSDCQMADVRCTTNGQNCVSLTLCRLTNPLGCIYGSDGPCILLNNQCQPFTKCSDASLTTHYECQQISQQCTSNKSICVSLGSCNSYVSQDSCRVNNIGPLKTPDGQILSTGACSWNGNKCADQVCSDLATNSPYCTSNFNCRNDDGTCFLKTYCSEYTQKRCVQGLDGACIWDLKQSLCRVQTCSDIQDGSTKLQCSVIPNCISDGTNCITVGLCSNYKTRQACQSGGSNGVCLWDGSTCSLMTTCAGPDNLACYNSPQCFWNSTACVDATCQTSTTCTPIPTWDYKQVTYCWRNITQCQPVNISTLNYTTCNKFTNNTYTWSAQQSQCLSCQPAQQVTVPITQEKPTRGLLIVLSILLTLIF